MVGRSLTNLYPYHESNAGGEEYLRIEDWTVHHPLDQNRVIVDHANINVHSGEIVGLAGLMGAGRTELAMSVFGKSYGSRISGKVFVKGKEVHLPNVQAAIDAGLAYATEDRKVYGLNLLQNIRENAALASLGKMSSHGIMDENGERTEVEEYRNDFHIKCSNIDVNVGTLSGGNQQKVVLAKWVISNPDILILDEPTRGIDVGAKYEIYEIINKLADEGKAIIVISSELPELIGICDRIYTVVKGSGHRQREQERLHTGIPDERHDEREGGCCIMTTANATPAPAKAPAPKKDAKGNGVLSTLANNSKQYGIVGALIVIVLVFQFLTDGVLLKPNSFVSLIQQNAYVIILAIGMVMVIIATHIDLSVGSIVAFVGGVCAILMERQGVNWMLAILISLLVGLVIGCWQGFWVAYVGIPGFITTLAGMLIFRGLATVIVGESVPVTSRNSAASHVTTCRTSSAGGVHSTD